MSGNIKKEAIQSVPIAASNSSSSGGSISRVNDRAIKFDHYRKMIFPTEIIVTKLIPDIVMLSRSTKQVLLIELTMGRLD